MGDQASVKTVLCGLDLVASFGFEGGGEIFGEFGVAVNDEYPHFSDLKSVGWDVMGLHEAEEFVCGYPAVARSGYPVAL